MIILAAIQCIIHGFATLYAKLELLERFEMNQSSSDLVIEPIV